MVFKCGPNQLIYSLIIISSTELLEVRIQSKIHNIQLIANDFNGSISLLLQIVCNFWSFSLVRFYSLVYPKTVLFGFEITFK